MKLIFLFLTLEENERIIRSGNEHFEQSKSAGGQQNKHSAQHIVHKYTLIVSALQRSLMRC